MASGSNLVVKISAVDATSAAIDSVAKRLAGITAPAKKVTASLARLSDATGVTKLATAIGHLGGTAVKTGESLSMALGGIPALTAALSVGGVAKMTSDWARVTQSLSFDATRIGSGVSQLHALEGSARLSGSSAEAAASGLRTLQDTLVDTVGGRNMQALVYLRQLNVAFDDGRGHALRATDVMPKLADALSKITDRSIRARVGTALLGGAYEELAPWIDRGSKGMAEYAELARKYGVNTEESARTARVFGRAQTELTMAFEGLGNSISENVAPALSGLMTTTANWIGANREMFALDVKKWGEDYSAAFGRIGAVIDKGVTSTIGWNNALEFGVPLLASRMIPPIARLENALAKLALVQIPSWLGGALGIGAGGLGVLATPLLLSGDTPKNPLLNQPSAGPGFFGQGGTMEKWIRGVFGGDAEPPPTGAGPATKSSANMDPTMRGFLDTLAGPESHGQYNIKNGGSHFDDYSQFPEGVGPGGKSTAAGRYQFISKTWHSEADNLGLKDFSPDNQDKAAWHLADTTYRSKTGRDLEDDLKAGNRQSQIATALGPIWPSLPGGSQSNQSQDAFNRSLTANTSAANGRVDVHVHLSGEPPGTTTTARGSGAAVGGVRVERSMAPT